MMSLNQSYQYEQQNSFFDLSAGSINDFDFFNIHSGRQQEAEYDGGKVMIIFIDKSFKKINVYIYFSHLENVVMILMMLLMNFINKH